MIPDELPALEPPDPRRALPWWEHVDAVPLPWLIDVQLRSAWTRWADLLRLGPGWRVPGSFGLPDA